MNYFPAGEEGGSTYAVRGQWVIDQWQQNKLTDGVACAGHYRCLTSSMQDMMTRSEAVLVSEKRQEFHREWDFMLSSKMKPFKKYDVIVEWMKQYNSPAERFDFLWIWGDSKFGKSKLAMSLCKAPFRHKNSISWSGDSKQGKYCPMKHDGIIFDDIKNICDYIVDNKIMFQASEVTTVNTSKTNLYAEQKDTRGKMIIICSNDECFPGWKWIHSNARFLEIKEPTWIDTAMTVDREVSIPELCQDLDSKGGSSVSMEVTPVQVLVRPCKAVVSGVNVKALEKIETQLKCPQEEIIDVDFKPVVTKRRAFHEF